jgi:hypothetical protein
MSFSRWGLAVVLLATAPGLAQSQEGSGCDGFRWNIDRERAGLARPDKPSLANGGVLAYDVATTLALAPIAGAGLPIAPERPPKSAQSFAGHFTLAAPAKPGVYKVTISSEGWLDVLDNGAYLHPTGFTGATGCDGARKSVKFDLPPRALGIQLSGVKDERISVIISPAE